ncbi:MAG: cytochrome c-type biogenesis protein CcmH, partial [Anaerolineae bacterium]
MLRTLGKKIVQIAFTLLLVTLLIVYPTAAQQTDPRNVTDDQVNAIAHGLYCPVCENITLDVCGTAACADWRAEIRTMLEAGWTEQQIVDDFVRRFGDRVV